MIYPILSLLILSAAAFLGLNYNFKRLAAKSKAASSGEMAVEQKLIDQLDEALKAGVDYIQDMLPLSGALELEKEIADTREQVAAETKRLADLDAQLNRLQASVAEAETAHAELKRGKEDADKLAEEINNRKESLQLETKNLESELTNSQAQLQLLADEVSLTDEQKAALKTIEDSLTQGLNQLKNLVETYNVAATRFTNLELQYRELEKEYTKLVEKELAGSEDEEE